MQMRRIDWLNRLVIINCCPSPFNQISCESCVLFELCTSPVLKVRQTIISNYQSPYFRLSKFAVEIKELLSSPRSFFQRPMHSIKWSTNCIMLLQWWRTHAYYGLQFSLRFTIGAPVAGLSFQSSGVQRQRLVPGAFKYNCQQLHSRDIKS